MSTPLKPQLSAETKQALEKGIKLEPKIEPKAYKFVATIKVETKGRGGKTVTVIDQLPKQELFLRELTTELKKKCGSGGTYITDRKEGVIEIQGDKIALIRDVLTKRGIQSKG
jgi:translation initiation factor 1